MDKKYWIIIIVVILLLCGGFVWWVNNKSQIQPQAETATPTTVEEGIDYQIYTATKVENWLCRLTNDLSKHDCTLPTGLDENVNAIDITSDNEYLYVLNNTDNGWLAKINLDTWTVEKKVADEVNGFEVAGHAISVDDKYIYVANDDEDWIHRWDKDLANVDVSMPASQTEGGGNGLASDGTSLYVSDRSGNWVRQIDIATWTEIKKSTITSPTDIAVDSQYFYSIDDTEDKVCRWKKDLTEPNCEEPTVASGIVAEKGGNSLASNGTILVTSDRTGNWLQVINLANWQITKVLKGVWGEFYTVGGDAVTINNYIADNEEPDPDPDEPDPVVPSPDDSTDNNNNNNNNLKKSPVPTPTPTPTITTTPTPTPASITKQTPTASPSATRITNTPIGPAKTGPALPFVSTGVLGLLSIGLYLVSRKIRK